MKDINKSRLVVWSIILVVTLSATVLGILKYKAGYGRGLQAKEDLEKIVNAFNTSQFIQSYRATAQIKAENKSSYALVKYSKGIHDTLFTFEYKEEGPIRLIELKYTTDDKTPAEVVARGMIEATATVNGAKDGEVFNNYTYDEFRNTSLSDGVTLINNGDNYTIKINIKANVVENLKKKDAVPEEANETGFLIIADEENKVEDYITYTLPEGFENNSIETANNKCYVRFDVVTNYDNYEAYIKALTEYSGEEATLIENSSFKYYKITENKTNLSKARVHHAALDINEKLILVRMDADAPNEECDGLLGAIIGSITVK